ncbi:Os05g0196400, partial [Oryza sativa Japonica Group]
RRRLGYSGAHCPWPDLEASYTTTGAGLPFFALGLHRLPFRRRRLELLLTPSPPALPDLLHPSHHDDQIQEVSPSL